MGRGLRQVWVIALFLLITVHSYSQISNVTPIKPSPQPSTRAKFYRRLSSTGSNIDPVLNPPNEMTEKGQEGEATFNPYFYPYFVGFEGALPLNASGSLTTSVIQMPAVAFGAWTSPQLGFEC